MASRSNDENIREGNVQELTKCFEALASKTGAANSELHEGIDQVKKERLQGPRDGSIPEGIVRENKKHFERQDGSIPEGIVRTNKKPFERQEQLEAEIAELKNILDTERKRGHAETENLQRRMKDLEDKMEKHQEEMEWIRLRNTPADITLAADTAHPNLSIAGDKKSLKHEAQPQNVPPNPERFDATVCVLGTEGFSSGKHYWEVDVGSSTDWDLGVARKSIERKGKLSLSPKEGFWVLGLSGKEYWGKTDPWTRVMVQKKLKKIGVCLNYQEGQVTIFNVTDMSVLFTFKDCSFSGEVCPFFKSSHKETTMRIFSDKVE